MVFHDYWPPYERVLINRNKAFLTHLLAGAIAGVISKTLTAPLDRVKIFYQVNRSDQNIINTMKQMIQEEGIRSLWRSNAINILKTAPKASLRFAFYDKIKKSYKSRNRIEVLAYHERLIAGSIAGFISQTFTFPLDVIKVKMSLGRTGQYRGIIDATRKTYRAEGLRSFGKGYVPTIISIIPSAGMEISLYETLKKLLVDRNNRQLNNYEVFLTSSASCLVSQVTTYPLHLVTTRLQATTVNPKDQKLGMMKEFERIIARNGYVGLYRGLSPHLLKFLPVSGIMFSMYELIIKNLGIQMDNDDKKT